MKKLFILFLFIFLVAGCEDRNARIPAHHYKVIKVEKMKCELSDLPKKECLAALKKRIYKPTVQEMDENPDYDPW
jgi:uncharacterized protein YcfL